MPTWEKGKNAWVRWEIYREVFFTNKKTGPSWDEVARLPCPDQKVNGWQDLS